MNPIFNHPSRGYLIITAALIALSWSIIRILRNKDPWRQVENVLVLLLGSTALLAVLGSSEGWITWKIGAFACITVLTLFWGAYAIMNGIVCGLKKKQILTNDWKEIYVRGQDAVQRGWVFIILGVLAISAFFAMLWALITGNYHW